MAGMIPGLIIVSVLLALALAAVGWLWAQRNHLRQQVASTETRALGVEARAADLETRAAELSDQLHRARTDAQLAQQALTAAQEQFTAAQQQARDTFQALAADVLQRANQQFLQLAQQNFRTEQVEAGKQLEARKQAVEALVKPISDTLVKYNQSLQEVENARQKSYGALSEQVRQLQEHQQALLGATSTLASALKRTDVGGRWGEVQLRRVAELAGMIPHCDFDEQASVGDASARQRPDMVVKLPAGRVIVVDSKTVLRGYLDALEAGDERQRKQLLEEHARNLDNRVRELAAKAYTQQFERTPDFVVQFIPGEAFLYAALQVRPDLLENALQKGVILATPSTLVSLLRVIALGWREEQVAEGARQISDLGKELHQRLFVMIDHITKLGQSLDKAVGSYNSFVGSLESRVLPSARRFEQLGASGGKTLPEALPGVDTAPRSLREVEESA